MPPVTRAAHVAAACLALLAALPPTGSADAADDAVACAARLVDPALGPGALALAHAAADDASALAISLAAWAPDAATRPPPHIPSPRASEATALAFHAWGQLAREGEPALECAWDATRDAAGDPRERWDALTSRSTAALARDALADAREAACAPYGAMGAGPRECLAG